MLCIVSAKAERLKIVCAAILNTESKSLNGYAILVSDVSWNLVVVCVGSCVCTFSYCFGVFQVWKFTEINVIKNWQVFKLRIYAFKAL